MLSPMGSIVVNPFSVDTIAATNCAILSIPLKGVTANAFLTGFDKALPGKINEGF